MSSCSGLVALEDGTCGGCGRRWARYGDRLEHRRGRHDGSPAVRPPTPEQRRARQLELLAMPWEELERRDLCECGLRLSTHPALPKPGPFHTRSWENVRVISAEAKARMDAARVPAQIIWGGGQPLGPR